MGKQRKQMCLSNGTKHVFIVGLFWSHTWLHGIPALQSQKTNPLTFYLVTKRSKSRGLPVFSLSLFLCYKFSFSLQI